MNFSAGDGEPAHRIFSGRIDLSRKYLNVNGMAKESPKINYVRRAKDIFTALFICPVGT